MNKNNPVSIIVGGVLLLIFALLVFVYQVRTTEVAVVTTFGKPTDRKTDPGAYFKLPWPIQKVYFLDKRIRNIETVLQQSTTADDYSLLVMSYAGWAIDDPAEFFPRFDRGSPVAAESKLREMLLNAQKQVVGRYRLSDLINTNGAQLRFSAVEQDILQVVQQQCRSQKYGIDVKFVGIKRLGLPENNTVAVLDRMRSERQRLIQSITAEGQAVAAGIRTNALIAAQQLISQANAEAIRIKGQGEAEAQRALQVQEQNPELALFLYDLEALTATLQKATLVMDPSWPLIDILQPRRGDTPRSKP
jgi:membrane protease subunit HflC